jgi:hypothetical protein
MGVGGQLHAAAVKEPPVPTAQQARWAPVAKRLSLPLPEIEPQAVQPVVETLY